MSTLLDLDRDRPAAAPAAAGSAVLSPTGTARPARSSRIRIALAIGVGLLVGLSVVSLFIGAGTLTWDLLWISRIPRTVAVLLAGAAMALAGMLMQLLVRNRFVEPSTVGTTESAGLGLLLANLLAPSLPLPGKMLVAVVTALLGTFLFLRILRAIPPRSSVIVVPLVGMMLSGIISAVATYIAYSTDLLQSMGIWMTGDFSGVMRGRFELLWVLALVGVICWIAADRFTVASLGESTATSLGLRYKAVLTLGLSLVAITAAVTVVVVGALPFLGLVVPNLVCSLLGDNLRRNLPVVALSGALLVLICDILARTINQPFEVPVGIVVGVVGAAIFLAMLLRRGQRG